MVTCKKCGLVDDFHIIEKSIHKMAYCNGCKSYIKNIPYTPQRLHFGKYKGDEIANINDLEYLKWVRDKVTNISNTTREAVSSRIYSLENMLR